MSKFFAILRSFIIHVVQVNLFQIILELLLRCADTVRSLILPLVLSIFKITFCFIPTFSLNWLNQLSFKLLQLECTLTEVQSGSCALKCLQVDSVTFNTHSKVFTGTQSTFKCIQVHSMLAQRRSHTLIVHSSAFNRIHTRSTTFASTHFHEGISSSLHSVTFRLMQRHS